MKSHENRIGRYSVLIMLRKGGRILAKEVLGAAAHLVHLGRMPTCVRPGVSVLDMIIAWWEGRCMPFVGPPPCQLCRFLSHTWFTWAKIIAWWEWWCVPFVGPPLSQLWKSELARLPDEFGLRVRAAQVVIAEVSREKWWDRPCGLRVLSRDRLFASRFARLAPKCTGLTGLFRGPIFQPIPVHQRYI